MLSIMLLSIVDSLGCGPLATERKSEHDAGGVRMPQGYRVALVMTPQPEGGYTVTSPQLPGLVTEGDSLEETLANVEDALRATLELYQDTGRPIPSGVIQDPEAGAIQFDLLLPAR